MSTWNLVSAAAFCTALEHIAAPLGGHVALTGGTLYKGGERKDVDILIYRSLDEPPFKWDEFKAATTKALGIEWGDDHGWCKKAYLNELRFDFFDPFSAGGYPPEEFPDLSVTP